MRFKIDWASLVVGRKFIVFAFFYFVKLRALSKYKLLGGLYLEGQFNGGQFALRVWGAYIWRKLYIEGFIFGILITHFVHENSYRLWRQDIIRMFQRKESQGSYNCIVTGEIISGKKKSAFFWKCHPKRTRIPP